MLIRENNKFRQELSIPCYDTDACFRLKPEAFMDLAQEIAFQAASVLGFGYDNLHVHHVTWVLSRMHVHFDSYPLWRDEVTLYTWHKGLNGLYFQRDFRLNDPSGKQLICCTSSWVVINEQTRRVVRPEEIVDKIKGAVMEDAIAEPAPKLQPAREGEAQWVMDHQVAYSDTDIVGHTNNARYVLWAMDALPYEQILSHPIRDLYINFIKETTPGQQVSIFRTVTPEGYDVEGRVEGKTVFVCRFVC